MDHGDDRTGVPAYRPQELLEWIGERERVHPAHRELIDVVPGGPHLGHLRGPHDDCPHPALLEIAERVHQLLHRLGAQGVALGEVVQCERPDLVVDADLDRAAHREAVVSVEPTAPDRRERRLRFLIRLPQTAMSHHAPRPAWERS